MSIEKAKAYLRQFGAEDRVIEFPVSSATVELLAFEEVEPEIGHAVGGVCPFGVNDGVTVYLDESLRRFETVFPACGSSNSAIEVTIPELEKFSGFKAWVDICKGWREA